jgi:hypothetical protein
MSSVMIIRINSDYIRRQNQPDNLCSGETLCFLWGRNWISKFYLDEHRMQIWAHQFGFLCVHIFNFNYYMFQEYLCIQFT